MTRGLGRWLAGAMGSLTAVALAGAAPAVGSDVLSTGMAVPSSVDRSCDSRPLGEALGAGTRSLTAPDTGWITATLDGGSNGDWDLAVFDRDTGRLVAASSSFGPDEVASGLVTRGDALSVQACRRWGGSRRATVDVESQAVDPDKKTDASMVRISTPNPARKRELQSLGLDLTEHAGRGYVDAVVYGERDARKLRAGKFAYTTRVADLDKQNARDRAADARFARSVHASSLPSRRTTYRHLNDYEDEMKKLARANPGLVKPLTLAHKTFSGRTVSGIEISTNVNARDGKPVFLLMGVHHAREWPSGEHAMEWAYELVNGYRARNRRVRSLVQRSRTIIVPIVNPDGFNTSREAGGVTNGRGGSNETANIVAAPPGEYRRKNCRAPDNSNRAVCPTSFGVAGTGVDPNRNYGEFWGGPGASEDITAEDYRGPGPFSEPETQNIKELISARQVTTLITLHTFSGLVLRPPGIQAQGVTPDEAVYKALGQSFADENGYKNQWGFQLYDTTGTTEDWSYFVTGGLGFTFEIGPTNFHPPYAEMVAEYEGNTALANKRRDGKGNREALFKAQENTTNPRRHSELTANGPSGGVLRITKQVTDFTSPVLVDGEETTRKSFGDRLSSSLRVADTGKVDWHVNPSTRPVIAQSHGRLPRGRQSAPLSFSGLAGPPSDGTPPSAVPCGDADTTLAACYNDHAFRVPSGAGIDNARAAIRIAWSTPASDWDMRVFQDTNGDGKSANEVANGDPPVGSSTQGTTATEATSVGEPLLVPGARYVIRVINFGAAEPYDGSISFLKPLPFQRGGGPESWNLTCEVPEGRVVTRQKVVVRRGQRKAVSLRVCVRRACARASTFRIRGKSVASARLGRTRRRQRRLLGGRLLSKRGGMDKYCLRRGGVMRIGYSTKRQRRRLSRKERRRVRGRALLIVSSSKRHRVKRIRVGTRTRTMRRRLKHERGVRVGRNVWWLVRGRKARVVFKTRRGKVREIGLVNRRLTRTKRRAKRLLRTWELPHRRR